MLKKTKEFIIQNKRAIIFFISIVAFVIIVKALFKEQLYEFDACVYKRVIKYMNPYVTQVLKIFTNLGGAITLVIMSLTIFICLKERKISKYVIINLLIITCVNQILKYIFARERPNILRLVEEHGYSFPSGHSMVSMAFYGFLIYLLWIKIENKRIRFLSCAILSICILIIGISRIYLGVHYASDVLAGFCISLAYLMIYTKIISKKI